MGITSSRCVEAKTEEMKKVTFNEDKNRIHIMVAWNFAYRKSRENIYGAMVLDRLRFKRRIQETELLLNNILNYNHRCEVYESRFNKYN